MYCASCLGECDGDSCRCGEDPRLAGRLRLLERRGPRLWRSAGRDGTPVDVERVGGAAELPSLAWDRLRDDLAALVATPHPALVRALEVLEVGRPRERALWLVREPVEALPAGDGPPPAPEAFVAAITDALLRWGARLDHVEGHGGLVRESFAAAADGRWVLADFGPARLRGRPAAALSSDASALWSLLQPGGSLPARGAELAAPAAGAPRDLWRLRERLVQRQPELYRERGELPPSTREAWSAGAVPTRPVLPAALGAAPTPGPTAPPPDLPPPPPVRGLGPIGLRAVIAAVGLGVLAGWWGVVDLLGARLTSPVAPEAAPAVGGELLGDSTLRGCAAAWRARNPEAPATEPHLTLSVRPDGELVPRPSLDREHDLFRDDPDCVQALEGRSLPEGLSPREGSRTLYAVELRLGPDAPEPVELRWTIKPA